MKPPPHHPNLLNCGRLTAYAVRRPGWILALSLVVTVLALTYAWRTLSIDASTEGMLSRDLPFQQNHSAFRRALPALKNNIVIVIDGLTPELADTAAQNLSRRLADMPEVFGNVFDPANHPFFRRNGLLFLSPERLDERLVNLAQSQPLLATLVRDPSLSGLFTLFRRSLIQAEQYNMALPGLAPAFTTFAQGAANLSRDAKTPAISWRTLMDPAEDDPSAPDAVWPPANQRIILAQPFLDFSSLSPAQQGVEAINQAARSLGINAENGTRLRLTGSVVIEQDELLSVREGALFSGALSFVLVATLTIIGLRSLPLILSALITLIVGLIWTAGYAALTIGHLNIISVAFAVLFVGLGIDFGIQYGLRYREEVDPDNRLALRRTATRVAPSLTLAATAAAIGFLSFTPTDYVGLAELGQISAVGVIIALIANFTVLPALLTLWPARREASSSHPTARRNGLWRKIVAWLTPGRGRVMALAGGCLTVLSLITGGLLVTFDYDPLNLKDPNRDSYRLARELQEHSGHEIAFLADSPEEAQALRARLEALPVVGRIISPNDYVPTEQDTKLALINDMAFYLSSSIEERPTSAVTPTENRAALQAFLDQAAQSLNDGNLTGDIEDALRHLETALRPYLDSDDNQINALQEVFLATLPDSLERLRQSLNAEPITLETLPPAIKARVIAEDGRHVLRVFPKDNMININGLSEFIEAVSDVSPKATGPAILIYRSGQTVVDALRLAGILSLMGIGLLLLMVLRQPAALVLAMAPLLLAVGLTMSVAGLLAIPLNFANMIAIPLIVCLGVAYSLYMILRSREQGGIKNALVSSTPRAIVFSALTTMASFGSLALSPHRGTASMGILLTIALTMTLVATFTLLPALLAWHEAHTSRRSHKSGP